MRRQFALLAALGLSMLLGTGCSQDTAVSSPDGGLTLRVAERDGRIGYTLSRGETLLLDFSTLGFELRDAPALRDGLTIDATARTSFDQTWEQVWGEEHFVRNRYNELRVTVREREAPGRRFDAVFRLFDDGVGFRCEFPEQPALGEFVIMDELTEFRFPQDHMAWWMPTREPYYESIARHTPLSRMDTVNTPLTLECADGTYLALHEADLTDYAKMSLRPAGEEGTTLRCCLTPWSNGVKVYARTPFRTPWRTVVVGDTPGDLATSRLMLNLNEPSKIGDTEWIRPMKCIGVRWPTPSEADSRTAEERYDAATEQVKRYLEFAADNRIDAVLIGRSEGREARDSARRSDCCGPYRDFDIAAIAGYARDLGIELIGCRGTDDCVSGCGRQLDSALMRYAGLGMHNLMTDFSGTLPDGCSRRSQYGVRHCRRIVEAAARHCMTVDMREPVKDCGIRRTWPNMMTRSYGCGDARCAGGPPSHGVMLPFTRLLAGPMSCASGTFDILSECARDSVRFGLRNCGEEAGMRVNSTLAGQIADWVILYSPLQMASDRIEHYEGHPAFRFFRDFDPDCDWSRALAGEPGEYVVVVRRAGDRFYFGAATNERPRTLHFELDFLEPEVTYEAAIYADAPDADWRTDPTACDVSVRYVTSADAIDVVLAPGGGQAISFLPL